MSGGGCGLIVAGTDTAEAGTQLTPIKSRRYYTKIFDLTMTKNPQNKMQNEILDSLDLQRYHARNDQYPVCGISSQRWQCKT